MKRAWQIACLAFAAFAVLTLALSTQYAYRDLLGPGPAFFPVWMSGITAVLSLALLVQTTVGRAVATSSAPLRPDRPGALRILAILAALVGSIALLDPLGFRLSLFLFLIVLPPALGARNWWFTVVFALAGSFGVFHVFYYWLKVPLEERQQGGVIALGRFVHGRGADISCSGAPRTLMRVRNRRRLG